MIGMTNYMKKANIQDIVRARYIIKDGKHCVKISVKKGEDSGVISFGGFDSKEEAQHFYRQLKLNK